MKLLAFGGNGQLGKELEKRAALAGCSYFSSDLPQVDIVSSTQVEELIQKVRPDVIINCAAFTQVDLAEERSELADRVNRDGPANMARVAKRNSIRLLHLSTDYVFSGEGTSPLKEDDQTNPVNVYGQSKLKGEQVVLSTWKENSLVVRTASLHGQYGPNFVHTMLDLFKTKEELKVVSDQFMSPTWAGWLAEVLLQLALKPTTGILHVAGGGGVSWYEFARHILNLVRDGDAALKCQRIEPCSASDFVRAARRPAFSVLNCSRLTSELGIAQISWQNGVIGHLSDLELI